MKRQPCLIHHETLTNPVSPTRLMAAFTRWLFRKVKCSGGQPCKSCVQFHHQCIYSKKKKTGPKPATKEPTARKKVSRVGFSSNNDTGK